jgi:ribonuclease VapC
MIVVDTSALMAIVMKEVSADACSDCRAFADDVLISAGTLMEALIVSRGRDRQKQMEELLVAVAPQVIALTEALARRAANACRTWGKGFHRAALNFGDCFAYALAKERDCSLLFVGKYFAATDISIALPES